MKLSYAIMVCNEHEKLFSLISFLLKVKDDEDEINILFDATHGTDEVKQVLLHFKEKIIVNEREFDGNFSAHRNYHKDKCNGDYIFTIDADEMPQEKLIKEVKSMIEARMADAYFIPRINIIPGSTSEWLKKNGFKVNDFNWINWPDYGCKLFKNIDYITFQNELHERVVGFKSRLIVDAHPNIAIWHIKSIETQDKQWDSNGNRILF